MKLQKNITILLLAAGSLVGAIDVARVARQHLASARAAAAPAATPVETPAVVAVR